MAASASDGIPVHRNWRGWSLPDPEPFREEPPSRYRPKLSATPRCTSARLAEPGAATDVARGGRAAAGSQLMFEGCRRAVSPTTSVRWCALSRPRLSHSRLPHGGGVLRAKRWPWPWSGTGYMPLHLARRHARSPERTPERTPECTPECTPERSNGRRVELAEQMPERVEQRTEETEHRAPSTPACSPGISADARVRRNPFGATRPRDLVRTTRRSPSPGDGARREEPGSRTGSEAGPGRYRAGVVALGTVSQVPPPLRASGVAVATLTDARLRRIIPFIRGRTTICSRGRRGAWKT